MSKCDNTFRDNRSFVQLTKKKIKKNNNMSYKSKFVDIETLAALVGTGGLTSLTNTLEAVTESEASDEE